jgi:hypothetical protein
MVSRLDARFHPDAIPPRCFAHPRGFDPHQPLRPCFMPLPLLGFRPSELLPASELFRARHPAIPSRCSSSRPEGRSAAPPGVSVGWQSDIRDRSVASWPRPLLSWVSIASTAFRSLGLASSLDGASAPDLCFGSVRARPRSWSSASSSPTDLASPALAGAGRPSVPGLPFS